MKNLLSISTLNELAGLSNDIGKIRYMEGMAREYRYNASTGQFLCDKTVLGSEKFELILIAYRCFSADLYGMGQKDWTEIYFLNKLGNLCVLKFHTYSTERFKDCLKIAFYNGIDSVRGMQLVIESEEQKGVYQDQNGEAQTSKYYIANFTLYPLDGDKGEAKTATGIICETFNVFSEISITSPSLLSVGVNIPQHLLE